MENNNLEITTTVTTLLDYERVLAALQPPQPPLPMLRRYALWDIDNCLADDRWRCHLIDWSRQGDDRYRRYNSQAHIDAPKHLDEFQLISKLAEPIFLTGRPEYMRDDTEKWIEHNLKVTHGGLWMRPDGCDMRPAVLKQEMLLNLYQTISRSRIIGAFDDVPAIIQMYLDNRIPAVRLAIHDEHLAYAPEDLAPATPI